MVAKLPASWRTIYELTKLTAEQFQEGLDSSRKYGMPYFRLLTIAADDKLAEVPHAEIPASWFVLYELTKLTPEQFQDGLDSGAIHPGMQRKDVREIVNPKEEVIKPRKLRGEQLVTRCTLK